MNFIKKQQSIYMSLKHIFKLENFIGFIGYLIGLFVYTIVLNSNSDNYLTSPFYVIFTISIMLFINVNRNKKFYRLLNITSFDLIVFSFILFSILLIISLIMTTIIHGGLSFETLTEVALTSISVKFFLISHIYILFSDWNSLRFNWIKSLIKLIMAFSIFSIICLGIIGILNIEEYSFNDKVIMSTVLIIINIILNYIISKIQFKKGRACVA